MARTHRAQVTERTRRPRPTTRRQSTRAAVRSALRGEL